MAAIRVMWTFGIALLACAVFDVRATGADYAREAVLRFFETVFAGGCGR